MRQRIAPEGDITHLGRRANARQQTVLDWIGGQCSRLGRPASGNLQVDHRIDWSRIHLTEPPELELTLPRRPPPQEPPTLGPGHRRRPPR